MVWRMTLRRLGPSRTTVALATLFLGAPAAAQQPDNIGLAGQVVVGAERLMGVFFTHSRLESSSVTVFGQPTSREVTYESTSVGLFGSYPVTAYALPRLAFDYFPIDGLSVGGSFVYLRVTRGDLESNGVSLSPSSDLEPVNVLLFHPRVGYSFIANETFALWPRAGMTLARTWTSESTQAGNTLEDRETLLAVSLEANLVVSPATHLALLVGPFVDFGVYGKRTLETTAGQDTEIERRVSVWGLQLSAAGYF
jgi:hypothetical protein